MRIFGKRAKRGTKRTGSKIPWFTLRSGPWGTVYLMQSVQKPRIFKVGLTTRKTITRRAELNRNSGHQMKIVATVSLPWARVCEARVLKGLRRNPLRKGLPFGTEWFELLPWEDIKDIDARLQAAAARTKLIAHLRLSWSNGDDVQYFLASRERSTFEGGQHPC